MAKGMFEKQIAVDWNYLTDETLRPGGIKAFRNGFFVKIKYPVSRIPVTTIPTTVRYYGRAKNGRMWVNSFSYSVQHLPKEIQKELNKAPYRVAKYGLEVVGVVF